MEFSNIYAAMGQLVVHYIEKLVNEACAGSNQARDMVREGVKIVIFGEGRGIEGRSTKIMNVFY